MFESRLFHRAPPPPENLHHRSPPAQISSSRPPLLLLRCGLCLVGQPLSPPQPSRHCEPAGSTTFLPFHATILPRPRHPDPFPETRLRSPSKNIRDPRACAASGPIRAPPGSSVRDGDTSPPPSPWTPKPSNTPHLPRSISQPPSRRVASRRCPSSPTTSLTSSARRRSKPSCTRYLDQSPRAYSPPALPPNQTYPRLRRPPRLDGDS